MAIKALTDAMPDKNAAFYVKDKSPHTVDEVCTLCERYCVLHGEDDKKGRNTRPRRKKATRKMMHRVRPIYSMS